MRINNAGHYEYCRWASKLDRASAAGIHQQSPITWFQNDLASLRQDLLEGRPVSGCQDCWAMEQYGKVSGRQRQLLKTGVREQQFVQSLASSPWVRVFERTSQQQGITDQTPQDWQIDLGNYCNSACVFCTPFCSSRLATEFQSLGLISRPQPRAWCDDPVLLDRFLADLVQCPNLKYLHFIGGETLITPGFRRILEQLVAHDLARQITIGFTTNLTTWSDSTVRLLDQFQNVNLGMSIECVSSLNDYVRYGSEIDQVMTTLSRWIMVARERNWLIQLRPTPNILTIGQLRSIYELAWQQGLAVESCNFIARPEFMKPSVLPPTLREPIIQDLEHWIEQQGTVSQTAVINTRDPNQAPQQILQDAVSYVRYLKGQPDHSHLLADLVTYLRTLERSRGNCVLDHLPQYEQIFRSAGY